ncbi:MULTISPECIES: TetR/AcrR family transcriptional regulator [unclassified Arthrobacter]|uniref:TetR/AcrR family transcriptional regulator n=1 Tax=unclassified Arthrobacter TaxID=235627 RepID=UPI00210285BB|nr:MULTISPECIES: TetR/AcrR family transcriptional regulator [unclassified Arthrobacter]MCQ1947950.1 TetR/AcrR family transcriptional regulator [Arthrobacter sp. zg-Y1116]MCQ1987889.1 TetR/AcrR family transcriptional regulator [Arthrobacter sp. zg-Y844]MCQ1996144.1 TetR/AcrR family transcriptional regulator [Arthrobacter sp. zg-Y1171]UWX82794.1 TetR/AcrR family transcriptional regulator [Arthrobacter sp. zg-Y1171]
MPRESGTKRAILDAALDLAAANGISGTTMDDVAERAGVAKGSLYYNFSSKDKLFEKLLLEGVGALTECLRNARSGLAGWQAIESMVRALLELLSENRALAKLMAAEILRTDRTWQHSLHLLRQEALAEFVEPIRQTGGPAGLPDGGSDRLTLIAGSVFGATLMGALDWLVFDPERSVDDVAAAVLYALSGRLQS